MTRDTEQARFQGSAKSPGTPEAVAEGLFPGNRDSDTQACQGLGELHLARAGQPETSRRNQEVSIMDYPTLYTCRTLPLYTPPYTLRAPAVQTRGGPVRYLPTAGQSVQFGPTRAKPPA